MKNIVRALLICTMVSGLHGAEGGKLGPATWKGKTVTLQKLAPGAPCAWKAFERERTEWIAILKAFPNDQAAKTALGQHAFYAMGPAHVEELHEAGANFEGARKKAINIVHEGASEKPETEWSPMHLAAYYACVLNNPKRLARSSLNIMLYLSSKAGVPLNQKVGDVTTQSIVDTYAEENSPVAWLLGQYESIQDSKLPKEHFVGLGLTGKEWCGIEGVEFDPDAFYEKSNS